MYAICVGKLEPTEAEYKWAVEVTHLFSKDGTVTKIIEEQLDYCLPYRLCCSAYRHNFDLDRTEVGIYDDGYFKHKKIIHGTTPGIPEEMKKCSLYL